MSDTGNRQEPKLSETEYAHTMDQADREQALYDAREYLIAGLANQAEWWEHLGDAHRDYAALARAVESIGLLDDAGRMHRMVEVVTERDHYRNALQDIASREWRDEGGRIAAAITRDALGVKSDADPTSRERHSRSGGPADGCERTKLRIVHPWI